VYQRRQTQRFTIRPQLSTKHTGIEYIFTFVVRSESEFGRMTFLLCSTSGVGVRVGNLGNKGYRRTTQYGETNCIIFPDLSTPLQHAVYFLSQPCRNLNFNSLVRGTEHIVVYADTCPHLTDNPHH